MYNIHEGPLYACLGLISHTMSALSIPIQIEMQIDIIYKLDTPQYIGQIANYIRCVTSSQSVSSYRATNNTFAIVPIQFP